MKKYRIKLEGGNCLLRISQNDQVKKYGFFTSRNVEADDLDTAKEIAIQMVCDELRSKNMLENAQQDPPVILIDEVRCVMSFDHVAPTKGFAFFVDENLMH